MKSLRIINAIAIIVVLISQVVLCYGQETNFKTERAEFRIVKLSDPYATGFEKKYGIEYKYYICTNSGWRLFSGTFKTEEETKKFLDIYVEMAKKEIGLDVKILTEDK